MSEFAPAKINLFLHVTGRRPDGYHLLESLAVFAAIGDELSFEPSDALSLTIEGPEGAALAAEPDNLILRAARALAEANAIRPTGHLSLRKHLPVSSGIGGGSADAAATLRLLCKNWALAADPGSVAAKLGADVPVCVSSRPALMRGIGDHLSPAPQLPPFGMVLANPRIPVATSSVFKARTGPFSPSPRLPRSWPTLESMIDTLAQLTNDLEPPAIALCPTIAEVLTALRELPDVLIARMSGSGATCFALFPTPAAAAAAAVRLPAAWWRWGGGLYDPAGSLY